jgi:hypothetical protein
MADRIRLAAGLSLLIGCWPFAAWAEGRTAPSSDSSRFQDSAAAVPVPVHTVRRADPERGPFPGAPLLLSAPLSDVPYGLRGGFESPSMRQSLQWHAGATQFANQSIGWMWEGMRPGFLRGLGTWASLAAFDYFFMYLPPGTGWMHEEWHRSVLTNRGYPSYDGIYHWDIGAAAVSVDHVADKDLAELKLRHPGEFTRLMSAGLESETEAIRQMRRNNFFLGRRSGYDLIDWWTTGLNGTAYLYVCATSEFDSNLVAADRKELKESQRDFTGLDFRAWVYDMRHPKEPYKDSPRGRRHFGGQGFDRYFLYGDLTAGERGYLKLQAGLSLLNFVSPQYFGRDWLPGKNPWSGEGFLWNFGLMHHLTPFGYEVGGDFLVRRGKWSWIFSAQSFVNGEMALPGLGGELYRYPVTVGTTDVYLTCGGSAWLQPQDQLYYGTTPLPGFSALLGAAVPLLWSVELFGEADAKTQGWQAGNVNLDPAVQARAGLQLKL